MGSFYVAGLPPIVATVAPSFALPQTTVNMTIEATNVRPGATIAVDQIECVNATFAPVAVWLR